MHRLDKEISADCAVTLEDLCITIQLVPPCNYWCELARRAIQTYKNHFKVGLSGDDPVFLLIVWDKLVKQENATINLLSNSCINPNTSAFAHIFGQLNHDAKPLTSQSYKYIVHENHQLGVLELLIIWAPTEPSINETLKMLWKLGGEKFSKKNFRYCDILTSHLH